MRIKSLRAKMIVFIGLIMIFSITAVSAAGIWVAAGSFESGLERNVLANAENFSRLLKNYEDQALAQVKNIAANTLLAESVKRGEFDMMKSLSVELMKNGGLEYLVVTDTRGKALFRAHIPGEIPGPDDFIINQVNIRQALAGNPFAGIEEGRFVRLSIRAGAPLYDSGGELAGAVSAGYVASQNSMLDKAKSMFGGEFSLFLGTERVGSTLDDGGKRAAGDVPGTAALLETISSPALGVDPLLADSHVTAFAPLSGAGGKVIGLISASLSRAPVSAVRNSIAGSIALAAVGIIALALSLGVLFARSVSRPVMALRTLMASAGAGDLTVYGEISKDDEISELTATFNQMVQRQSDTVERVRRAAEELASASGEIASSSEEITHTSHEVAMNISNVSELADKGSAASLETNQVLLELSSLIQMAQQKGRIALERSSQTLVTARAGRDTVLEAVEAMNGIRTLTAETEARMETLNDYSRRITTITDTITGIARQTNLLALNAAIEAARAGDAGRGFAVVADEVRILAEQSNKGAAEVAQLVQKIAENTSAAVEGIRSSRSEVDRGVTVVDGAGKALEGILSATEDAKNAVAGIVSITDEEVASSEKVVSLIASMGDVIVSTAGRAEQVAAATEETAAAMEVIGSGTGELSAMAAGMNEAVRIFKVPSALARSLSDEELLKKAKSDHLLWKVRISNMLNGIDEVAPEDVDPHTGCRLGKWYFSPGNSFKDSEIFKKIDAPHREVHDAAHAAAAAWASGDPGEARRQFARLDKNSRLVIKGLDSLLKKARMEDGKK